MVGSRFVGGRLVLFGMVGLVVGLSLVFDISNIAGVSIGNIVGNNLGPAIGKVDTVFTMGGISVTVLVGGEVGSRVVISNGISVVVDSGSLILGLLVVRRSMVSGLVSGSRGVVSGGMDRCLVDRGLVGRGVVDGCLVGGGMVHWLVSRGVVHGFVSRGSMVDRGRLVVSGGSMVSGGGMVSRSMDGLVGRSMSSGSILLLVVGLVDLRGLSRGLAHDSSVVSSMGLVHRSVDSRGIAVLDGLMAGLVSTGDSHKGGDSDKSLENNKQNITELASLIRLHKVFTNYFLFNSLDCTDTLFVFYFLFS